MRDPAITKSIQHAAALARIEEMHRTAAVRRRRELVAGTTWQGWAARGSRNAIARRLRLPRGGKT